MGMALFEDPRAAKLGTAAAAATATTGAILTQRFTLELYDSRVPKVSVGLRVSSPDTGPGKLQVNRISVRRL
jgi:hypothetical protein